MFNREAFEPSTVKSMLFNFRSPKPDFSSVFPRIDSLLGVYSFGLLADYDFLLLSTSDRKESVETLAGYLLCPPSVFFFLTAF